MVAGRAQANIVNLGERNGPGIDNADEVLPALDRSVARAGTAFAEVIWFPPLGEVAVRGGAAVSRNPFGHVALRYAWSDGRDQLLNVTYIGRPSSAPYATRRLHVWY